MTSDTLNRNICQTESKNSITMYEQEQIEQTCSNS